MGWLFNRSRDQTRDEQFIRYCQRLFAFQQYSMEVFNDGMAATAGVEPQGDFIERLGAQLHSPALVDVFLVPAISRKCEIIARMREVHVAYPEPTESDYRRIHESVSALLDAIEVRAEEQRIAIERWVTDPDFDPDHMTDPKTDAAEQAALLAVINPLNKLIERAGFAGPPFLEINAQATNEVRVEAGLLPLPEDEFVTRYFAGLSGMRARFFDE